jgi:putative ABC transport system ATP-binding protein
MENDVAIEITNLNKSFKNKAVFKDLNLSFFEREITTVFGPSGSGKSTLLNILGTLEDYDSGNIVVFGKKLPRVNSKKALLFRRECISYLFQNFGLLENDTIKANLKLGLEYRKLSLKEQKRVMRNALNQVGLDYLRLNQKVYNLSGGEQQRIALARILIKPAKIILADEPTGSLDVDNRNYVMDQLVELKKLGKTVIVVTHDAEFKKISDYIIEI